MKTRNMPYVLLAACFTAADQLIKAGVRKHPLGACLLSLPPLAEITHQVNTGAAFSLLRCHPQAVAALAALLLVMLVWYCVRMMRLTAAGKICAALLIAGGAGNLIDRLVFGCVTDYIRLLFVDFPVFNLADILITCSIAVMAVLLFANKLETNGSNPGEE